MTNDINLDRRDFLKALSVTLGAIGATTTFGTNLALAQDDVVEELTVDYIQVDADHEHQVKTFLDNIGKDEIFWRKPLEFTMDGDVKVFNLTCTEIYWETQDGVSLPAFAYNGMVPGPEIRVTEGDAIRIIVQNDMRQSTSVHWHGVRVPNAQDGVPFVTQPVILPGASQTYEFTVKNPGTHMYHSHHNSLDQVLRGLLGAFIIEPADKSQDPEYDHEFTMILNDSMMGFTINGKSFPYTQPLVTKLGEKVRIRYMNEGLMIHPMHLHGLVMEVFAKDGWNLPMPYKCDTLNIAPGERYDVIVDCDEPGVWAFHCHILSHVENRGGLFGMVSPFIVNE
jgi:FtsP/CotA-like multicopper oxidase with cupredoxin domain